MDWLAVACVRRVLVIDDCVDTCASTCTLLRTWGYRAFWAANAPQAIDAVRLFRPDIVLLDLVMPRRDGFVIARQLRAEGGLSDVCFVAITACNAPAVRERCRAEGFAHFLSKPVDLEQLQRILGSVAPATPRCRGLNRPGRADAALDLH